MVMADTIPLILQRMIGFYVESHQGQDQETELQKQINRDQAKPSILRTQPSQTVLKPNSPPAVGPREKVTLGRNNARHT